MSISASELAVSLRAAADWLDAHPDLKCGARAVSLSMHVATPEELAAAIDMLGGEDRVKHDLIGDALATLRVQAVVGAIEMTVLGSSKDLCVVEEIKPVYTLRPARPTRTYTCPVTIEGDERLGCGATFVAVDHEHDEAFAGSIRCPACRDTFDPRHATGAPFVADSDHDEPQAVPA